MRPNRYPRADHRQIEIDHRTQRRFAELGSDPIGGELDPFPAIKHRHLRAFTARQCSGARTTAATP